LDMSKTLFVVALVLLAGAAVQASSAIHVSGVPSFRWDQFLGKVVLVTGGSAGIGFATAHAFARYGARVIICSRDSNPAWFNGTDAQNRINADPDVISLGGYARWVQTDVSERDQVDALIENIKSIEGTIDFAFNNAGIAGFIGNIMDEKLEELIGGVHDTLKNNIFGMANCMAAEIQLWDAQNRSGVIVNTASLNSIHGAPNAALYCTSKHAVLGLTKSVAVELGDRVPPIRINCLAPGFTDTSLVWQQCKFLECGNQSWEGEYITKDHELWKKWGPRYIGATPAGKLVDPYDQATMVLYLCSEEAQYISGAAMVVDGGLNSGGIAEQ